MIMSEVPLNSYNHLSEDDLLFMEEQRSLKDLSSTASTSSGESSHDTIFNQDEQAKEERAGAQEEQQPLIDFDYLFDGLDLPETIVEEARKNEEEKPKKEDCHAFYGELEWCDEIMKKFEAQLDGEGEEEKAIMEVQELAEKLIEDHKQDKEKEKLTKKMDKEKRRALSAANKATSLFCCFMCSKGFVNEESCQRHVNEVHLRDDERYPFKCPECHMRFAYGSNLYRHKSTHNKDLFRCSKCPSVFKVEQSLVIHMARDHNENHDDDKYFICSICNHDCVNETEFKRHIYYCKNKGKITQQRKEKKAVVLGNHVISPAMSQASISSMESTSSEGRAVKDKSCPYCLDVFASMQSRNRHIGRKHPEMKDAPETNNHMYLKIESPNLPYACNECGKRFASSASYQTHKKRIHEKKLDFVCEKCLKAYPLGSELRKHMKRVHKEDVEE